MINLSSLIVKLLTEQDSRYKAIRQRVIKGAEVVNNNVGPTVGTDGSLHAPFDGYHWDGKEYQGGSYLHIPADVRELMNEMKGIMFGTRTTTKYVPTVKIRGNVELYKKISDELIRLREETGLGLYEFSHGQTWDDGECYLYAKSTHPVIIKALQEYANEANRLAFEEAKKNKGDAPEGRLTISGKVIKISDPDPDPYNLYPSFKMLVVLENKSTVFGSLPKGCREAEVGDFVEFTATFTRANGDSTHAWFKRPSKAKILQIAEKV